jgi:hypothetical protein
MYFCKHFTDVGIRLSQLFSPVLCIGLPSLSLSQKIIGQISADTEDPGFE